MEVYLVFQNDMLLGVYHKTHGIKAVARLVGVNLSDREATWTRSKAVDVTDPYVQRWWSDKGTARLSVEKEEVQ